MLDLVFSGLEAIGTVVGAYFIAQQIALTRNHNDKNEFVKRKEITLNAYNSISDELRKHNEAIKLKFNIQNHDKLTEENLLDLQKNPEFLKHLHFLYDYLERFAIGVKNEIYDIDVLIEISGRWFVRTYDRHEVYIFSIRNTYSNNIHIETEKFIENIRTKLIDLGEENLKKN